MLYNDTITEAFQMGFKAAMAKSDAIRQSNLQDMAAFYHNDYEEICEILKEITLNNPYTAETQRTIKWQHMDQLSKMLKRMAAGIYTQRPVRKLMITDDQEDVNFAHLLEQIKFNSKVKEALRAARFFNICMIQPVWDMTAGKLRLDVILPNDVSVKTKPEDYLKLDGITIRKCVGDVIRYSVWTETEHYYIEGETKYNPANNNNGVNPFAPVIPVSTLRLREGVDFYGEPNWNLYLAQRDYDIDLTEMSRAKQRVLHQVYLAINCNLKQGERLSPGQIITADRVQEGQVLPSIESVTSNYDFQSIRENAEWTNKMLALSQGLSASSVSTEVDDLSGIAKMIDNQEMEESRQELKDILYDFEVDLMQKIRIVYNTYSPQKLNEAGQFFMAFVEDPASETIQDKVARREMEKAYGYKNEVDFAIEDMELNSREEAIQLIQSRAEETAKLTKEETSTE